MFLIKEGNRKLRIALQKVSDKGGGGYVSLCDELHLFGVLSRQVLKCLFRKERRK